MSLKEEVLAVMQSEGDYEALLGVVRRYIAQGMASRQVYDVLQEIWLGFGLTQRTREASRANWNT